MGRAVIVAYKPKESKEKDLTDLLKKHHSVLRKEGLVTEKEPFLMKSANGIYIEVFEWISDEAISRAHQNHHVQKLWEDFEKYCTYERLSNVSESEQIFAEFDTVEI